MRTAVIKSLCQLAETDDRIWLLTADLGYRVVEPFAEKFPARFVNVGIAEQNMIGIAAGLAEAGNRVFCYSINNFATLRCLEQIRNDVCLPGRDVTIIGVGAGLSYGPQGYTHHGLEDLAAMRSLPGMSVNVPRDSDEAAALVFNRGPAYLRLGKAVESPPIGIYGDEPLTVIALGTMFREAMRARDELRGEGIEIAVRSVCSLKPLDPLVFDACCRAQTIVTVEEHSVIGGLGSAVAEVIAEMGPHRPQLYRFGMPDRLTHLVGTPEYIREQAAGNLTDFLRRLTRHGTQAEPAIHAVA